LIQDRGAALLPHEIEVAVRDVNAVAHLPRDAAQPVLDHFHVLAFQALGLADALVDDLDEPGNDGQRAVDVVDDAGVDFAARARDFLLQFLVVQFGLQGLEFFVVVEDFVRERVPLHGRGDRLANGGDVKRLVQIIARAQAQRPADGVHRFVSRQHDDFHRRLEGLELFQDFRPGHPGHTDVHHGGVDLVLFGQFQRARPVGGDEQVVIFLENDAQGLPRPFLIIHDQEGWARPVWQGTAGIRNASQCRRRERC
jgi:hypothetical protein